MGKWVHRLSNLQPDLRVADCAQCGPEVPIRYTPSRQRWRCRTGLEARSVEATARRTENKRAWAIRHRHQKYGVTAAQMDALLALQGDVCAICGGRDKSGRALAIDHDHSTGAVRGLLCTACNTAIGLMGDDPDRLRQGAQYLQERSTICTR